MVVVPSFDNSLSFRFDVVSLLKTNFKSSSSSMFEDYFRDILPPYFEFQKFNSCRLIHLGGVKFQLSSVCSKKIYMFMFYPLPWHPKNWDSSTTKNVL